VVLHGLQRAWAAEGAAGLEGLNLLDVQLAGVSANHTLGTRTEVSSQPMAAGDGAKLNDKGPGVFPVCKRRQASVPGSGLRLRFSG
jgi:hypothetical protein